MTTSPGPPGPPPGPSEPSLPPEPSLPSAPSPAATERPDDWQGRLARWAVRQRKVLFSLESVIGIVIVTLWAVLGGLPIGTLGILILFGLGLMAHWTAIATASHMALWAATVVVLGLTLVTATVFGLPPLALTVMTCTALVHNEMIRLNHSRRRAEVDIEVFHTAGLTVAATAGLAIAAVALAVSLNANFGVAVGLDDPFGPDDGNDRSWLWTPAAAAALLAVAVGLAVVPRRLAGRSRNPRWQPGQRIPPQPLPTSTDSGSGPAHR